MTSSSAPRRAKLNSGWILVTGLLTLCVLGTWLTARNYRQQVLASTSAVVLENQWPEKRISATFTAADAKRLREGQSARVTVGGDKTLIPARLLSVGSGSDANLATIAVTGDDGSDGKPRATPDKPRHHLPVGASCSVSVDTSIPIEAGAVPSSVR